jgi:hypothetical protein
MKMDILTDKKPIIVFLKCLENKGILDNNIKIIIKNSTIIISKISFNRNGMIEKTNKIEILLIGCIFVIIEVEGI